MTYTKSPVYEAIRLISSILNLIISFFYRVSDNAAAKSIVDDACTSDFVSVRDLSQCVAISNCYELKSLASHESGT